MHSELEKSAIDGIVSATIEKFLLEEKTFRNDRVRQWCDGISRECLRDLSKLQKPYKFVLTCTINQRCGNALLQHVSHFGDHAREIVSSTHWKNDLLHCLVIVYALPLM